MNPALVAIFVAIVGGSAIGGGLATHNAPLYLLGIVNIFLALLIAVSYAFGDVE